ncbi:hypothetical protein OXX59_001866 [Metschnikowia pulcherrima]
MFSSYSSQPNQSPHTMKALAAAASSHTFSDQMSTNSAASSRRPSRLSMTSRRPSSTPKTLPSAAIEPDRRALAPVQSNSSAQSDNSNFSGFKANYKLSRVDSRASAGSALSMQSRYRVQLELSSKEISLLRFMWNKMLGEESLEDPASSLPLPGSLWQQAREKPSSHVPRHAFGPSSTFCSQLYSNLLTMAPDLETAFPSLRHQAVSMAGVLSLAVNSLENLAQLDDYFVELGNRHSRILGIEPAQFELMGEAFIQTFHERFGTRFTHELEVLWIKFYMYLANSLLQFGLDPVMRVGDRSGTAEGALTGSESVFTRDTESVMSADPRRGSVGTELSSVMSTRVPLAKAHPAKQPDLMKVSPKKTSAIKAAQAVSEPLHPVSPVRAKKKKGRLGRKAECAIM